MSNTPDPLPAGPESDDARMADLLHLIDGFKTAMLTTVTPAGQLHARPMAIVGRDDPFRALYFLTERHSLKIEEISADGRALVSMQHCASFVALSGTVVVETATRAEIDAITKARWAVWFADAETPDARAPSLLRFSFESAEYWNRSGTNRWRVLWQTQLARLKHETLRDSDLPGHGKLQREDNVRGDTLSR